MKKARQNKLKLISLVLSVLMLVPYMTGTAVATTQENLPPTEAVESNMTDTSADIKSTLPTELDISTVPDIVGTEAAQEAGHVKRAYEKEENLNTVSFYNEDGTRTEYVYNHPVKYVDTDGSIKDITLDIQAKGTTGNFISKDTLTETTFSQKLTDGIILSGEDVSLRLVPVLEEASSVITPITPATPETASRTISKVLPTATLKSDGKSVVYTLDSKTSYEYSLTYSGFKEDIIVSEYTGQTEYDFKLYTNGLALTEVDGDYYLCDSEGKVKGQLGSVIVFTADWQNNTFGSMTAETVTENQEYIITIQLDAEYLSDEATLYPITIDPTIELNYNNNSNGIHDIVINSVDVLSGTDGEISAGKWGSDQSISRILMKFPGLNLNSIPSAGSVVSATVYIRDLMCQHDELTLDCYAFTGNIWYESSATWNNVGQPSSYNMNHLLDSHVISYYMGLEQTVSQEYGFDITNAVRGWKNDNYTQEKGIIFKASAANESNTAHNYKTFASYQRANYKPYLVVVYDDYVPGISFTVDSLEIPATGTVDLNDYISVYPTGASVSYTTSNSSYASVSTNGTATALEAATNVTITATVSANGIVYTDFITLYSKLPNLSYGIEAYPALLYINSGVFSSAATVGLNYDAWYDDYFDFNKCTWAFHHVGENKYIIRPAHNPTMLLASSNTGNSVVVVDRPSLDNLNASLYSEYVWEVQNAGYSTYTIRNDDSSVLQRTANDGIIVGYADEDNNSVWSLAPLRHDPKILVYDTSTEALLHDTSADGSSIGGICIEYNGEYSLSDHNLKIVFSSPNTVQNLTWTADLGNKILSVDSLSGTVTGKAIGSDIVRGRVTDGNTVYEINYEVSSFIQGSYYIKNKGQKTYIDKDLSDSTNGADAILNSYNDDRSQQWYVTYNQSQDYYSMYAYDDDTPYNLGIENNSESQNASLITTEDDYATSGYIFTITLTDSGAYKIASYSGKDNGYVLTARLSTESNHSPIEQRAYTNNTDYRDEWYFVEPSNTVKLEPQQTDKWCWAASARMMSMHYMNSPVSQASAAVYTKSNIETMSPTDAQVQNAYDGANVFETATALEYILGSNNVYSDYEQIYTESNLKTMLDNDNPVVILRGWYNNANERTGGHYVVIYGYHWNATYNIYLYDIFDPWDVNIGASYTQSYQSICNGRNKAFNGDIEDTGIWEGIVVYEKGNYRNTTSWLHN